MTAPAAITGLGLTETGKVYGRRASDFAAEAVRLAAADAGLTTADLDGLLVSAGKSGDLDLSLVETLGLTDLSLCMQLNAFGASAIAMAQTAAYAIGSGAARHVACVFADAPLRPGSSAGSAYRRKTSTGYADLLAGSGITSTTAYYALAAQRHIARYGTTSEQLGAVAVSQRAWARRNPRAQLRTPLTVAEHQSSRWIVEPLHLLDCCLVSNGGAAVIVSAADHAADLRQPPVHLWGWGQGHPGYSWERGSEFGLSTGAVQSGKAAMAMAGVGPGDIGIRELYDCYTYTVVVTLEDYGFCAKGEGGALAASGALGPDGPLPTNTGGGQLSSFYLWGMTPLSEAVVQARGQGGDRQAADRDVVLVSGNGGLLQHHSTLIVSPHPRSAS